jgi:hypothetical protein
MVIAPVGVYHTPFFSIELLKKWQNMTPPPIFHATEDAPLNEAVPYLFGSAEAKYESFL